MARDGIEPDYCPYSDNHRGNCAYCPYWEYNDDNGLGCYYPDDAGDEITAENKDPRNVLFPLT